MSQLDSQRASSLLSLWIQSDNTWMRMLALLSQGAVFQSATHAHLEVGHTHEDVDAVFSLVTSALNLRHPKVCWLYSDRYPLVLALLPPFRAPFQTNSPLSLQSVGWTWMLRSWQPHSSPYLQDHPRTDGYVVNNHGDRKSPKDGVVGPLPNGLNTSKYMVFE